MEVGEIINKGGSGGLVLGITSRQAAYVVNEIMTSPLLVLRLYQTSGETPQS